MSQGIWKIFRHMSSDIKHDKNGNEWKSPISGANFAISCTNDVRSLPELNPEYQRKKYDGLLAEHERVFSH